MLLPASLVVHANTSITTHLDCPAVKNTKMDAPKPPTKPIGASESTTTKHDTPGVIAVVQFTATAIKEENLAICTRLIRRAKLRGAEMVFLPECFDYICASSTHSMELAEPVTGPIITAYCELARELQIWLSLGGFHLKDEKEPRVHNAHIVVDSSGKVATLYRKTHLFVVSIPGQLALDESQYCIPGKRILPPLDTPVGRMGLLCCYDLRFPEISSLLAKQGAELIAYPAAFTVPTGLAHWEPLLRARAIENQCYVVAAAQCGAHNEKRQSYGHAMIVDPWGTVVAQCQDGPGIAVAEIDLEWLKQIRSSMPVQSHRRHDLYRLFPAPVAVETFSTTSYNFGGHSVLKGSVFYETSLTLALVNLKPVVPGHVLVIPKRYAEKFTDLEPEETGDLFHVVQVVEKMLLEYYEVSSATICIQDGFDAGQTVKHLHVHLLPRRPKDFQGDDVYKEMDSHDKGENRKPRTQEQMSAEAAIYRRLLLAPP